MKKLVKESGQGLVEYALILVLVTVVVMAVLILIQAPFVEFDQAIDNGEIVLVGNEISLGMTGNPRYSEVKSSDVRSTFGGSTVLESHPRKFVITGCENLYLLLEATVVYAATPIGEGIPSLISIQTPLQSGGYVQVCVPDELKDVPVYLWSK